MLPDEAAKPLLLIKAVAMILGHQLAPWGAGNARRAHLSKPALLRRAGMSMLFRGPGAGPACKPAVWSSPTPLPSLRPERDDEADEWHRVEMLSNTPSNREEGTWEAW